MIAPSKIYDRDFPSGFQAGDRVLVSSCHDLPKEKRTKVARSLSKLTGCDLRILYINCLKVAIWAFEGTSGPSKRLTPLPPPVDNIPSVVNVGLTGIDLSKVVCLVAQLQDPDPEFARHLREWAGEEVDVKVVWMRR